MTLQLRHALNAAYAIFARYEYSHDLILPPGKSYYLRGLSVADWHQMDADNDMGVHLYPYAGKDLFRHFLPRWLEWLSEDEATRGDLGFWELWNLASRLGHAQWNGWPAAEVAALRAVFEIWAREEIAHCNGAPTYTRPPALRAAADDSKMGLGEFSADSDLLKFLAEIGEAPIYLELWLDTNLLQLARWLWTADWKSHQSALRWALLSRLESELEAAFFADPDGADAELFSRSIELVRSLRAF